MTVGRGFAVTLLLRYLLEQCADVPQALEAVAAVPVNLSYNIALVDASGQAALVRVAPDRGAAWSSTAGSAPATGREPPSGPSTRP